MTKLTKGSDGLTRCAWCAATPDYVDYHDTEWGFPVDDDQRLFEKICLEGFQSGLSWRTILDKRQNFRRAFKQFNFNKIARFTERDIEQLLKDDGIVRHRGKIEATVNNAKCAVKMVESEGSLAAYFWTYEPLEIADRKQVVSVSAESTALSKDLKKRGWKFVGPTTAYAFMQAMGMVNDHAPECSIYDKVEDARKRFERPAR